MRRADHSSRGVLPTVMRRVCDLETSRMRRRPGPRLAAAPRKGGGEETLLDIGYFGADGEVPHSFGLECGSVEGIYKHRYETLGFIESRSLIYETFISSTLLLVSVTHLEDENCIKTVQFPTLNKRTKVVVYCLGSSMCMTRCRVKDCSVFVSE